MSWPRLVLVTATLVALAATAAPVTAAPTEPGAPRAAAEKRASAKAFTLAVVPDTQTEVFGDDTRLQERFEWLARRRDHLGLRFVAHVGDLTNWGWLVPRQLTKGSDALRPLEQAGVPYSIAVGNHDTRAVGWNGRGGYGGRFYEDNPECLERFSAAECRSEVLLRRTDEINDVFDTDRFGAVNAAFEPGKIDNVSSTFRAGGVRWLVLDLELWPRPEVVAWANEVVASHPRHNVVVNTHHYVSANNGITKHAGYGDTSPRELRKGFISQHRNIVMVVSGHVEASAATRVDEGVHGNKVVSLLTAFAKSDTNPVRLVRINPARGVLKTRIVAPSSRVRYPEHRARVTGMRFVG
jgi:hypothetical protein